jgi:uncharacterized protein involved in exopolysaccharide biosynthesis
MAAVESSALASDEISLRDFFADLSRARIAIAAAALLGALLGAAAALVTTDMYEARVVVAPALQESTPGGLGGTLSSLASQYSGIAALAGISLSGGGKKDESVAVLKSELLTSSYIREQNLLPVLYAGRWDAAKSAWIERAWSNKHPTVWTANQYFNKKIRRVTEDTKSGLIVVAVKWRDPDLAAKWANDLVRKTNDYLRESAISESERNIRYLNEQAKKADFVEARRAINSLLEQEINKEMLARGRKEYALKVIDPAVAPEEPSSAGPLILGLMGFALGAFLAVLGVFGRRALAM